LKVSLTIAQALDEPSAAQLEGVVVALLESTVQAVRLFVSLSDTVLSAPVSLLNVTTVFF
jgi:hypothetical protein